MSFHSLSTTQIKAKKFLFDDVGDENISEDDTNSKIPNVINPKTITTRF